MPSKTTKVDGIFRNGDETIIRCSAAASNDLKRAALKEMPEDVCNLVLELKEAFGPLDGVYVKCNTAKTT